MNKFKCFLCSKGFNYSSKAALMSHLQSKHEDELEGLPAAQVYFNYKNRYPLNKKYGTSVLFKKKTKWNPVTERYERFSSEKEKEAYRAEFVRRMEKTYGKTHLLNDPEVQKKMLANRRISGVYVFEKSGKTLTYTGKYEKDFIKKLDKVFNWNADDIFAPAPKAIKYLDENNVERFYIPDFYIASLDLLVEIKSGENKHYRARDLNLELRKDEAARKSGSRYIKILDKEYEEFFELVMDLRLNYPNDN